MSWRPPLATPPPGICAITVIVAKPTARGVTSPIGLTDIVAGALDVHVSEVTGTPGPSRSPAVSCVWAPAVTVIGGARTVTATVRESAVPGIETVTVTVPEPMPTRVARNGDCVPGVTVARVGSLDVQTGEMPEVTGAPLPSSAVSTSCAVLPLVTESTGDGASEMDATVLRTVMVALAVTPSIQAVMVTVPAPVAVTTPLVLTVATCGSLVIQVMERPVAGCSS